jgi:hypothetical protein
MHEESTNGGQSRRLTRASVTTRRRQIGPAGTQLNELVPCLGQIRTLHGRVKPPRATVLLGRAQSFTRKLFLLVKLALTCKL